MYCKLGQLAFALPLLSLGLFAYAQATPEKSVSCTFEDGKALTIRYTAPPEAKKKLSNGSAWAPGGRAMILLTETPVTIGENAVGAGAYSIYLLPNEKQWSLIVNKKVEQTATYDSTSDIARVAMESGRLSTPVPELSIALGHVGPKQCNMRIYYAKRGMWAEIKEKKRSS